MVLPWCPPRDCWDIQVCVSTRNSVPADVRYVNSNVVASTTQLSNNGSLRTESTDTNDPYRAVKSPYRRYGINPEDVSSQEAVQVVRVIPTADDSDYRQGNMAEKEYLIMIGPNVQAALKAEDYHTYCGKSSPDPVGLVGFHGIHTSLHALCKRND